MSKKNRKSTQNDTLITKTATPADAAEIIDNADAILASMSDPTEIVESSEPAPVAEPVVTEAALEAAVADAETKEIYAAVESAPIVEPTTVTTPADATTKKAKAPAKPRLTFAKPAAKIAHKLGAKMGETLVLDASDALLDAAALEAKQAATLAEIDGLAKKVGEKAVQLLSWMTQGGACNEIMARGFKVLATEGFITSGDKGNMQAALADKYTIGTSRSQANQLFCLFPVLGITKRDGKGKQVLNPDSVIFAHAKTALGL